MAADEIHVGDIGTVFTVTIKDGSTAVDISSATGTGTKLIKFRKPSGAVVSKAGVFVIAGVDGQIKYTTVLNDLDEAGPWKIEGYVEITAGKWHSDIEEFEVFENLS